MEHAITFQSLTVAGGNWGSSTFLGGFASREDAEKKLEELGFSEQQGHELGDATTVWLHVQERKLGEYDRPSYPQYRIRKAEIHVVRPL